MPPYRLGARRFGSKKEAKQAFRDILNAAPLNEQLGDEDAHVVGALLYDGRHPDALSKIGPGIRAISVRAAGFNTRCFWVTRTDGSEADFSYLTAIDGRPNLATAALLALREEVHPQIREFRARHDHPDAICPLCTPPQPIGDAPSHVDHSDPTFGVLAAEFAAAHGGWAQLEVACTGPYTRELADRALAATWQQTHRQRAQLRLVHAGCNLRRQRRHQGVGGVQA